MIGPIVAISRSIFQAGQFVESKKLTEKIDPLIVEFLTSLLLFSICVFVLLLGYQLEINDDNFWIYIVVGCVFTTTTTLLTISALGKTDLSIVGPFYSLIPVFTMVSSIILINEIPSLLGFLGIGLVFLGGYLSHLNKKNIKDSKPFKDLMKNRGVQLVFIATITAAIGNPMVKAAILASTVWTQIIVFTIIHSTLTGSLILIFKRKKINDAVKQVNVKWKNALMGNFHRTLTLVLGQIAFSLMYTAYATAIFRLSIFFQIYFGGKFFNEQNIKQRMIGAILIFAGVILILIS